MEATLTQLGVQVTLEMVNMGFGKTSLDPALPGSIMCRERSNISRCKPFFEVQLLKQGLHLEIFDPSW